MQRPTAHDVHFAHNSERQFALLLDFFDVPWEYEPHTFPIEFNEAGEPVKSFSPDFYLPLEDRYVEVTTLNQKLVTKKNRKVRLLKKHHPEINCRILYQRDYLELVDKYGLEKPTQGCDPLRRLPGPPRITELADRGAAL